ncbi:MAG: hypothetical protein KTR31_41370 [Myxococcales bacterium]|nr:hypothetical protein [Myxococcales bacterium]
MGTSTWVLLCGLGIAGATETTDAEGDEPTVAESFPRVSAYGAFVGGAAYEWIDRRDDDNDQRSDRVWTPALARLGIAGKLSREITVQSELEANAGPYGTSVWEGQAAIQVRNQLVRWTRDDLLGDGDRFRLEVGRITDPASVNYVSRHIANLLLSDGLARTGPLLAGFNRGNGVRAEYTVADALSAGVTLNAGNPTSTTATIMIGGTFPPFGRFYEVPWSSVGRDARGFPLSTFHVVMASPSLRLHTDVVQAQVALQAFTVDTNTNSEIDEALTGTNLRAGLRLTLLEGRFVPFVNGSRIVNDVVEIDDTATLANAKYLGMTASGGMDVNIGRGHGFGAQYDLVYEEERGLAPQLNHYVNAGVTWMATSSVFASARFALFQLCQEQDAVARCDVDGRRQAMLTLTAVLGPTQDVAP